MNREDLEKLLKTLVDLNDDQLKQYFDYYNILVEQSKVMNLTTITSLEGVYIKHFYDCLLLSKSVDLTKNITLCDIGSGAGFPGIVLKIAFPNLQITLVEPTLKRCKFLQLVIDSLALKGIDVVNDRAEKYINNKREAYDLVTARAVASFNILSELCVPFLKINGIFAALKGSNYDEELDEGAKCFNKLGINKPEIHTFNLPNESGYRAILISKKVKKTPMLYPRDYAKIKKNPL